MSASPEARLWENTAVLDALASQHYRPDMPQHDYPHALDVTGRALEKADVAIAHGVAIEREALPLGGRWHDAGKHLVPGRDHPFTTSEEYATDVSADQLKSIGTPEPLIRTAGGIILASSPEVRCATDTERAFVQADLEAGGIRSKPIAFLNVTYRLYKEDRMLEGQPAATMMEQRKLIRELVRFGGAGREILLAFLEEDLSTGDHDATFNEDAMRRVDLLKPERLARILQAYLGDIVNYSSPERAATGRAVS